MKEETRNDDTECRVRCSYITEPLSSIDFKEKYVFSHNVRGKTGIHQS